MKLYAINNDKLKSISSKVFKLEKDIQIMVEQNLKELFNLQFISSELTSKDFRIDTLAFDVENKSFVIIEYKKDRSFSVIDQGYAYMSLMLNNKSDFILEYNEKLGGGLKRNDIDWTQSRVIFISPQFTEYQKHSVNFKDVPFELWEIKRYENNIIGLLQHTTTSKESISTISEDKKNVVTQVSDEVKVYTEEDHLKNKSKSETIKALYYSLKERLINLGEVQIISRMKYIGFKRKTNFVNVGFQKDNLCLWINLVAGELDDPKKISRDIGSIAKSDTFNYELKVFPDTDLDYVMFLINQSYKKQD